MKTVQKLPSENKKYLNRFLVGVGLEDEGLLRVVATSET